MLKFGAGKCLIGAKAFKIGTVALFNPATQFATGGLGAWYDPSDYTTLTQDSAGTTPVTAVAQPVGRMLDKSGRGNTILQSTAANRPITGTQGLVQYETFNGTNSSMNTGAITLGANMDCFIAVRRSAAVVTALISASNTNYFGTIDGGAGAASAADQGSGAAVTYAANGVLVNGGLINTTRGQLSTATPLGSWVVIEVRNLDLSTWTFFGVSNYSGFLFAGDIGGIILAPAGNAAARQQNRQYLGNKVGLTLP